MVRDATRFFIMSVSILAVALAGCAKRPALMQASAPAPTGASAAAVTQSETVVAAVQAPAPAPEPTPPAASPATPAERPVPRQFEATSELRMIHFDFDKSDIRPGDAAILDTNARWLNANPKQLVLIEGHCDERGTNEYNLALGERRARATMNYLVSRGVQAGRMSTISYGEERPLCTEHNEACWSQNRRAQSLVKLGE